MLGLSFSFKLDWDSYIISNDNTVSNANHYLILIRTLHYYIYSLVYYEISDSRVA